LSEPVAALTASAPAALNGITLEIPDAVEYLSVLDYALRLQYPGILAVRTEIERLLGATPPAGTAIDRREVQRVIGYSGEMIASLIDREWFDAEDNECDELFEYLTARQLVGTIRSAFIWGAGPCRLGDYLAAAPSRPSVVCSDLSWPMLYFGRALIDQQIALLPELSLRDRPYYVRDDVTGMLAARRHAGRFKRPLCQHPPQIRYTVRDVYCTAVPIVSELVCVPFLLDTVHGARMTTMIVRLCQQSAPGQTLLILVTCSLGRYADEGRDPAAIIEALQQCGCQIEFVDLVRLPYSFTYHSFASQRTVRNTLVVRARRVRDIDPERIALVSNVRLGRAAIHEDPSRDGCVVSHNGADVTVSRDEAVVLRHCQRAAHYHEILGQVASQLDVHRVDTIVIGSLAAKGLIELAALGDAHAWQHRSV
jgi:hypothetical protein